MGQEFVIKSTTLEDKINQLLPSQGGAQAGVDLSASTTIIPIVDLTESAEGSNLRQDLQTALSFTNATTFSVRNSSVDVINTTGYYRLVGGFTTDAGPSTEESTIRIEDTSGSVKKLWGSRVDSGASPKIIGYTVDLVFYLKAGDTLQVVMADDSAMMGSVRQIADINGNLVNPS
mgnify:CR=1 FL=1